MRDHASHRHDVRIFGPVRLHVSEIRKIAKKTGITEKKVDEAVKTVRQRTSR